MFIVYMLRSKRRDWHYIGFTDNIVRRQKEHNSGRTRATKGFAPFDLIYTREFDTRAEARDYEKFLKIRCNKETLLKAIHENARMLEFPPS